MKCQSNGFGSSRPLARSGSLPGEGNLPIETTMAVNASPIAPFGIAVASAVASGPMCRLARCCALSPKPRPPFKTAQVAAAVRRPRRKGRAEILLLDRGATAEEIEAALGPHGYMRKMLVADRDRQIAAVTRWLSGTDGTLH